MFNYLVEQDLNSEESTQNLLQINALFRYLRGYLELVESRSIE